MVYALILSNHTIFSIIISKHNCYHILIPDTSYVEKDVFSIGQKIVWGGGPGADSNPSTMVLIGLNETEVEIFDTYYVLEADLSTFGGKTIFEYK